MNEEDHIREMYKSASDGLMALMSLTRNLRRLLNRDLQDLPVFVDRNEERFGKGHHVGWLGRYSTSNLTEYEFYLTINNPLHVLAYQGIKPYDMI